MAKGTIGWIVRTETAGHHRYWKVGIADAAKAAEIAGGMASADTARAVTKIPSHVSPAYAPNPGIVIEVVWESRPVAHMTGGSEWQLMLGCLTALGDRAVSASSSVGASTKARSA
jgi:hypothetical protein